MYLMCTRTKTSLSARSNAHLAMAAGPEGLCFIQLLLSCLLAFNPGLPYPCISSTHMRNQWLINLLCPTIFERHVPRMFCFVLFVLFACLFAYFVIAPCIFVFCVYC